MSLNVVVVVVHIYPPVTAQRQTLTIGRSARFHCNDYFELEGIYCTKLLLNFKAPHQITSIFVYANCANEL